MAIIHVQLLGEAVDVWRPVEAEPVGADVFRVLSTRPADERWALEPAVGQTVRCEQRMLSGGLAWVIMTIEPVTDAPGALRTNGLVDKTVVTLGVFGDDLDPATVTALLGCSPSSSFRKGDRRGPKSPPLGRGSWFLEIRGEAPQGPEELAAGLLERMPSDEKVWSTLGERYEVRLYLGIFMDGWNRGFDLSAGLMARLARLRAELVFDIYGANDKRGE